MQPVLTARDPEAWLATHLSGRGDESASDQSLAVVDRDALIKGDPAVLRASHRLLLDDGTPAPAGATYLSGWFAGAVAGAVGFGLAAAGAGFVVDPAAVRWHVHPGGWPERVTLGRVSSVAVVAGHPWAGQDGVVTVPSPAAVLSQTVLPLVDAVRPIVDACHALARVGRAGLWNEVADSLGGALAGRPAAPVTPAMIAVLDAAVRVAGVPWRAKPALRIIDASFGPLHVAQKGGCCLAYTREHWDEPAEDELDDTYRAYLARFPVVPGEAHYCTTCSLRDPDDSDARQLCWRELERAARAHHPTTP